MTTGFDAQRSNWVRSDSKISRESLSKPGFALVWKMKIGGAPLTPPALMDFYIGYRGFRTLGFFGAVSGRVVAVDMDLGRQEWEKSWPAGASVGGPACPGGVTSAVARPTTTAYPPLNARGFGRGTPAKSGVGEPFAGAVTWRAPRPATPPPPSKPKPRAAPEDNPYAPRVQYAMALSADGKLHSMWVSNGNEADSPAQFLPPNANASGLVVFDNTAYVTTANNCGGVDNGLWALDLGTKRVSHWKTAKNIAGAAAGPDGTIYAAAGGEIVALSPKKLETVGIYKTDGAKFTSSPVVFRFKGRNLLAVTAGDGRLHLVDTAAMGQALDAGGSLSGEPGALASWQDRAGTRWILAAASGAIVAWKVIEKDGAPKLQPGWTARGLVAAAPPVVVNDVVFTVAGANAVLYALDSATGKELWNSGATMASRSMSGVAAGGARVYVSTQDGSQYAFGFPTEH